MNTEDAWKNWWDSEGRNMERLPHHDAVDHLASMTRIAWLNGAFGAADEIERLRAVVEAWMKYSQRAERDIETLRAERDEARREVCSMNETGLRMNESDKRREAKRRGWQCFKEATDGK